MLLIFSPYNVRVAFCPIVILGKEYDVGLGKANLANALEEQITQRTLFGEKGVDIYRIIKISLLQGTYNFCSSIAFSFEFVFLERDSATGRS